MKRAVSWRLGLIVILLAASAGIYLLHFLIFRDAHHIFLYMVGDLAFLFIDILVVILFIEFLLERREKKSRFKKLNMVIGTFFSEVGLELMRVMTVHVRNVGDLRAETAIRPDWNGKDFERARRAALRFDYQVQPDPVQFARLRPFLLSKYPFLLSLLENPNLLEHERFTDLLWAVFHLAEELSYRPADLAGLPHGDLLHLAGDMRRACSQIVGEWIAYSRHLKESYPFLFSLAVRVNPLGPSPSAIVD